MKMMKWAAFATIGLLFGACSENQSTFNIEEIPGRCLIEGVVKYNEGTTIENGHFSYNFKPAADLQITLIVNNSAYGDLSGRTTFTTVTDAEGKYSIEIPAPLDNANVSITTEDFRGVRTFVAQEDNQIVTKSEDVIYRGLQNITVHSQGIVYANIVCTECSVDNPIENMTQLATLKGKVGQGVEYKNPARRNYNEDNDFVGYSDAEIFYVYEGTKADMIVTVDYKGLDFTYNVTSNNNGEWTLQVPVYSFPADFDYKLTAMPYNSTYTHYVSKEVDYTLNDFDRTYIDYDAKTLNGFYTQKFNASYNASFPISAQIVSNDSKMMVFEPLNNGQDIFGYSAGVYTSSNKWLDELMKSLTEE